MQISLRGLMLFTAAIGLAFVLFFVAPFRWNLSTRNTTLGAGLDPLRFCLKV